MRLRPLAGCLALACLWCGLAQAAPTVYRDQIDPHWSADGKRFWYRNTGPNGTREFVLVDADAGKREAAFDPAAVADKLKSITGKPTDAAGMNVASLDFTADADELVLNLRGGGSYIWNRRTAELKKADNPAPAAGKDEAIARVLDRPRPSRGGGDESALVFINQSGQPATLYWIDLSGERKAYGQIQPGERREQHTFGNHVWLAAGPKDAVLGIWQAENRPTTAVIGKSGNVRPKPPVPALDDELDPGQIDSPPPADDAAANGDPAAALNQLPPQVAGRPRRGDGARRSPAGPRSPDGKWVLTTRDDNLVIRPTDGGEEQPLTTDGKPGDAYAADRIWWSPDSAYVVAMRIERPQRRTVFTVESSPGDQVQPKLRELSYAKPGDAIDHPRPRLYRVSDRTLVPVNDELFSTPYELRDIRWAADSSRFTFVYNARGHQALRVVAVDPNTGVARVAVEDTTKTFVHYSGKYFCHWLNDDTLIWMSERSGWNHLYRVDVKAGAVTNPITTGNWVVRSVDRVDEQKQQVWFRAMGVRPGQDPYFVHYCRANFDGTGFTVLTEADGTHEVTFSPDNRYLIDRWSRVDQPPVHELRDADTGKFICKLEEANASEHLADRGGRWPVRFRAKGRDGTTDIYGVAWLPKDFDPSKKYAVIEDIYAGPHSFFVPKSFRPTWGERQRFADRGFIVVKIDGMGTDGRGKAFHDVCFKNIKDAGFPDRIAWMKALAKEQYPQMDLNRVGIYGGSAGGQNAMAALLWHNDFYKVAVADCGCHDNRMDKIWWNEQWMSWPVDDSYAANSNKENAKLLEGKLMLIVGELDDNVDPATTMQVAGAMQKAGKDFELVVVVNAKHGAAETPYGSRKRAEFLERNLK